MLNVYEWRAVNDTKPQQQNLENEAVAKQRCDSGGGWRVRVATAPRCERDESS